MTVTGSEQLHETLLVLLHSNLAAVAILAANLLHPHELNAAERQDGDWPTPSRPVSS